MLTKKWLTSKVRLFEREATVRCFRSGKYASVRVEVGDAVVAKSTLVDFDEACREVLDQMQARHDARKPPKPPIPSTTTPIDPVLGYAQARSLPVKESDIVRPGQGKPLRPR